MHWIVGMFFFFADRWHLCMKILKHFSTTLPSVFELIDPTISSFSPQRWWFHIGGVLLLGKHVVIWRIFTSLVTDKAPSSAAPLLSPPWRSSLGSPLRVGTWCPQRVGCCCELTHGNVAALFRLRELIQDVDSSGKKHIKTRQSWGGNQNEFVKIHDITNEK